MLASREPIRVLLVKPFQPARAPVASPPLGLLYLVSTLRQRFGAGVDVRLLDLMVERKRFFEARSLVQSFQPHVVGLSALNWEAEESGRFALMTKEVSPETIVAIGGPFAHRNTRKIIATGVYDWSFDGEADLSFPLAVERWFRGDRRMDDIVGLTWRDEEGRFHNNAAHVLADGRPFAGVVEDLDAIPFPAWDLIDFDKYARQRNFMSMLKGKRYATLFTSRGCPFLCTYCHDIFGKKFRWRSPENVAEEVRILREQHGVDELEIIDDIFNMNSPRMKAVCRAIEPYKMHLCFPNGLRFDILDEEGVEALVRAGTYAACVAVETVTPRLQELIKKRLRAPETLQAIRWMSERKVMVRGFFMLGFPTETLEEVEATIDFAVKSELTQAYFFNVVPQPGTPLYDLAKEEDAAALEKQTLQEYNARDSWYTQAKGVDMRRVIQRAYLRFFVLSPKRWPKLLQQLRFKDFVVEFFYFLTLFFRRTKSTRDEETLPEQLLPLARLYAADEEAITSASLAPSQIVPSEPASRRAASDSAEPKVYSLGAT